MLEDLIREPNRGLNRRLFLLLCDVVESLIAELAQKRTQAELAQYWFITLLALLDDSRSLLLLRLPEWECHLHLRRVGFYSGSGFELIIGSCWLGK